MLFLTNLINSTSQNVWVSEHIMLLLVTRSLLFAVGACFQNKKTAGNMRLYGQWHKRSFLISGVLMHACLRMLRNLPSYVRRHTCTQWAIYGGSPQVILKLGPLVIESRRFFDNLLKSNELNLF